VSEKLAADHSHFIFRKVLSYITTHNGFTETQPSLYQCKYDRGSKTCCLEDTWADILPQTLIFEFKGSAKVAERLNLDRPLRECGSDQHIREYDWTLELHDGAEYNVKSWQEPSSVHLLYRPEYTTHRDQQCLYLFIY
jgi:hypothetical protein